MISLRRMVSRARPWGLERKRGTCANTLVGYIHNGQIPYRDASGYNLDTQVLVFKVKFPEGAEPL